MQNLLKSIWHLASLGFFIDNFLTLLTRCDSCIVHSQYVFLCLASCKYSIQTAAQTNLSSFFSLNSFIVKQADEHLKHFYKLLEKSPERFQFSVKLWALNCSFTVFTMVLYIVHSLLDCSNRSTLKKCIQSLLGCRNICTLY